MSHLRFAWLVFALIAVRMPSAFAAERVALGGSGPDPQLARQLRVELGALGFDVVTLDEVGRTDLTAEILKLTRDDDLLAVIRVSPDGSRLEVWAADAESGIYVTRGIDLVRAGGQPRIIALRAVELLRAGLREIDARRQLARLPPPAPAAPERVPQPAPAADVVPPPSPVGRRGNERFAFGAGLGAVASGGGIGPAFVAAPSIELWPTSDWGVVAIGLATLDPRTVSNERGSSSVRVFLGGIGPAFRYHFPDTRWHLQAMVAAGGAVVPTTGSARGSSVAKTDVATTPTAVASVSIAYDVVPDLAINAALLGGALFPRATIQFAGQPVAHWGPLYGAGTLGASLQFR